MRLLESAVRDFGVGLVCVGGDQTTRRAAIAIRRWKRCLPVNMELSSKKVLPSGALVLVVHATEFPNGNQWARDIAFAALKALGPQDEMGIVLWDGTERWLFPLPKVGDGKDLGRKIAGMNPGDMGSFQQRHGHGARGAEEIQLPASSTWLCSAMAIPARRRTGSCRNIVKDRITDQHRDDWRPRRARHDELDGRPRARPLLRCAFARTQLPQIFIKEAAVILKSAIFEEPFKPQGRSASELVRGIGANEMPPLARLRGHHAESARRNAPRLRERAIRFWRIGNMDWAAPWRSLSDAKAKWAQNWMNWPKVSPVLVADRAVELAQSRKRRFHHRCHRGQRRGPHQRRGARREGEFPQFPQSCKPSWSVPKANDTTVQLEQTGPGHYEAKFPTKEVGAYLAQFAGEERRPDCKARRCSARA